MLKSLSFIVPRRLFNTTMSSSVDVAGEELINITFKCPSIIHTTLHSHIYTALRIKYKEKKEVFREESIDKKDPIDLFKKWFDEAIKCEEILEPNAMCLATVNKLVCPH